MSAPAKGLDAGNFKLRQFGVTGCSCGLLTDIARLADSRLDNYGERCTQKHARDPKAIGGFEHMGEIQYVFFLSDEPVNRLRSWNSGRVTV